MSTAPATAASKFLITSQYKAEQLVRRVAGLGDRYWGSRKSEPGAGETRMSELAQQRDQEVWANH